MGTQSFINQIAPGAQAAMQSRGILASLTIAQAALESGWGAHAPGNNLFGIKANGWNGTIQLLKTKEEIGGKTITITDAFRAYSNWAQSVDDHAAFLVKNSRYRNLIGVSGYKTVCSRIKADGYATAEDYAQQLIDIIEQYKLYKFDVLPTRICIDVPAQGAVCTGNIRVGGWAIAASGILRVDIYFDGKQGLASLGAFSDRPDVNKAMNPFGWYKNAAKSGFACVIPDGRIPLGKHTIDVAAIGCDGSVIWANKTITVK